jgi:hypothetical protein
MVRRLRALGGLSAGCTATLPISDHHPPPVVKRIGQIGLCEAGGMTTAEWEQRVAEAWASIDERDETEFLTLMEKLVEELPPGDPIGLFERACALDSTGHSDLAVPLYVRALDAGVSGERRRRSVIQMSSSLRNLGRSPESIVLLTAELAGGPEHPNDAPHLDDAAKCVLALALTDVGRAREGVALVVGAMAPHLPRYQRSMANYARLLIEPDPDAEPETAVRS